MKKIIVSALTLPLFAAACADGPAPLPESLGQQGANLTVDFLGGTDVAGFKFEINRVSCAGEDFEAFSKTIDRELEDMVFPGGVPSAVDEPLDGSSHHIGADAFQTLEVGCYDVSATPVNSEGDPSSDCDEAFAEGIEVLKGETTSVFLISQCQGDTVGAINTGVGINHPPQIIDFQYDPTKWLYECQLTEVCVTAIDVDNDPLEIDWGQVDGPAPYSLDPTSSSFDFGAGIGGQSTIVACAQIAPEYTEDYLFSVKVYDLTGDDERIENYVQAQGNTGVESNASFEFPLHVNWSQELQCWDGSDLQQLPGVEPLNKATGCVATEPAVYFCDPMKGQMDNFDVAFTCPGGTFKPENVYPACD